MRLPVRLSMLASLCMALPAAAMPEIDKACAARPVQWMCFGHLEVRSPQATVRISSHENSAMLVEMDSGGKRQRLLATGRGSFMDSRPVRGEFAFWGYALAIPMEALQQAFPDGPTTVPAAPETRPVDIEVDRKSTVTAWRTAGGEIRYRIEMEREEALEGSYRAGLQPALPGDFDLRGWYVPLGPQKIGEPPQEPQPAPVERLEQLR